MARRAPQKEKRLTNPNKVNQYTDPDPRQALFLANYFDLQSPTFGNAYQSAVAAKYSPEYAAALKSKMPDWLSEKVKNTNFLELAEKHFQEVMQLNSITQAMGAFGPIFAKHEKFVEKKFKNGRTKKVKVVEKVPVMIPNTSIIKEKTAVAKFVAEAHDKATYGKGGKVIAKFNFNFKGSKERYQ